MSTQVQFPSEHWYGSSPVYPLLAASSFVVGGAIGALVSKRDRLFGAGIGGVLLGGPVSVATALYERKKVSDDFNRKLRQEQVRGDMGTGGAPSLPLQPDYVDYGPTPAQLEQVKKAREAAGVQQKPVATAPALAPLPGQSPQTPQQSFLTKEAFGGIPVWGVILGSFGLLVTGIGVAEAVR